MATLAKVEAASVTRPPAKARPNGLMAAATAARMSAATAAMVKTTPARGWNAPHTSRTIADPARISSGTARPREV